MENNGTSTIDRKKMLIYFLITLLNTIEYLWISSIFPGSIINRLVFLTMISLFLNWIYYFIRFLTHLDLKLLHDIKERRMFKFSFSLSFLVVVLYWGMILADPSTLLKSESKIPIVLDLLLHGCNFLINLLEHLIIERKVNDRDKFISWKFFFFFAVFYTVEIKVVYWLFNFSPYPLVETMTIPVMIFMNIIAMMIMVLGEFIYNKISMMGIKKLLIETEN